MPIKIKVNLKPLKKQVQETKKDFDRRVARGISKRIDKEIAAGKSPVKGFARFQAYSDSYKRQITNSGGVIKGSDGNLNTGKRQRPVNLFVSGKMLKSKSVAVRRGNSVRVKYSSDIAKFHNEGTNKMPRRPLLPDQGEEFSRTITKWVNDQAKKSVDKKLINE